MNREMQMKQMEKLVKKAKAWGEKWNTGMMEFNAEYGEIVVYVGRYDVYKAGFDAKTLECKWTKC